MGPSGGQRGPGGADRAPELKRERWVRGCDQADAERGVTDDFAVRAIYGMEGCGRRGGEAGDRRPGQKRHFMPEGRKDVKIRAFQAGETALCAGSEGYKQEIEGPVRPDQGHDGGGHGGPDGICGPGGAAAIREPGGAGGDGAAGICGRGKRWGS